MSRRRRIRSLDLALTCGLAAVGLAVSLADPGGWPQAALLAPLVLFASGYAVTAAAFPPGTISREDRIVYSFVFSISASALGGLALQVVLRLDRTIWISLLVLVTVAASAIALSRRAALPIQRAEGAARPLRLPRSPLWALTFLAALTIAAGAIAVATDGVREQQGRQRFASLWAVPGPSPTDPAWLETGVWNHGGPTRYTLAITGQGKLLFSRLLRLTPGERWSARLRPAIPAGTDVLLVTLAHGLKTYRSLELSLDRSG